SHERLDPAAVRGIEPELTDQIRSAYLVPERAQIRNPRHMKALEFACGARGVRLRPGLAVEGIEAVGEIAVAVRTAEGPLPCGGLVVAAGPWSGGLLAGIGVEIPTPPVKGQIVLLRAARPALRRII